MKFIKENAIEIKIVLVSTLAILLVALDIMR